MRVLYAGDGTFRNFMTDDEVGRMGIALRGEAVLLSLPEYEELQEAAWKYRALQN